MQRVKTIHYRPDWRQYRPSLSGHRVFKAACGGWYIIAALTDHPELATCKRCLRVGQSASRGTG